MLCLFAVAVGAIPNNPLYRLVYHPWHRKTGYRFYPFDRNDENYFVQWALLSLFQNYNDTALYR